jgi:hypothetical protein
MYSDEILKLHKKLDDRDQERRKGNINESSEEEKLANLINDPGWEVLKVWMMRRIADFLEPVEYSPETPLDVRGALEEARRCRIDELRRVISQVETIVAVKNIQKIEKSKEESKSEA